MMGEHRLTRFADLRVGQRASYSQRVTDEQIAAFTALCGDTNPLHVDADFAGRTFFGGTIAHGLLSSSLISTVIGTLLPGTGAIYRSQTLEFLGPVHPGDTLTAWGEVRSLDPQANRIDLATWIDNQDARRVIEGSAVVSLLRGFRTVA
jgi:3-hydroxybutyryl-CoA dehydratase